MKDAILNTTTQAMLFPELCPIVAAVNSAATAGIEARGAIFTRREVVDFVLDLAGYSLPASGERAALQHGVDHCLPTHGRGIRRVSGPFGNDESQDVRDCPCWAFRDGSSDIQKN